MKAFIKTLFLKLLFFLARVRLKRLRLSIIGITGSIGKTSTKEAIATILKKRYQVTCSDKSYNTEFGLPLAILEQTSGFSSPLLWLKTLWGAWWKAFFGGKHLQVLVVEMGVDKPGDMDKLLEVVQPQIGIITNIKPVHLAEGQFKDLDDIYAEKSKLALRLPTKGIAVLNADDPHIIGLKTHQHCKKIFYGLSEEADVRARGVKSSERGISFSITYKGEKVDGFLPLLGEFQIYVILAAVAVAISHGFQLKEAVETLHHYRLPAGRMNPLPGIKDTTIIDSSYNASPESVKEALRVLQTASGRKIAILGNMNELGSFTEKAHREIGAYAVDKADILVLVGDLTRSTVEEALHRGFPQKQLFHFDDAETAGKYLQSILKKGDTILVKGSQNKVRLERLIMLIMKEPERANELLVRQDYVWKNIT